MAATGNAIRPRASAKGRASAAGGGSIAFRLGSTTFANAGTSLDIGVQDVAAAISPLQPDGTFDVKTTLVGGGGGLSGSAWNIISLSAGSGSKDITHNDLVAIVLDMTARAGADSVALTCGAAGFGGSTFGETARPAVMINTGSWARHSSWPNVIVTFDEGTRGWIDCGVPFSAASTESFSDSSNPDERGLLFQVPFDCTVGALCVHGAIAGANCDFTLKLYSDPTGTPAAISGGSVSVVGDQIASTSASASWMQFPLPSYVSLSRNTDYGLALKVDSTTNFILNNATLGDTAYRTYFPGGTTMKKITRNNGSGAFTAESPAVTIYQMGVRISQIHDGAGGGSGGGIRLAGPGGLAG